MPEYYKCNAIHYLITLSYYISLQLLFFIPVLSSVLSLIQFIISSSIRAYTKGIYIDLQVWLWVSLMGKGMTKLATPIKVFLDTIIRIILYIVNIVITFRFLALPMARQNRHYISCLYQQLHCHMHKLGHWKVIINKNFEPVLMCCGDTQSVM